MELKINSIISQVDSIDSTEIDGEKVMMDIENGKYLALNSVGTRIWDLIESQISISEIVHKLLSEYDIDKETCEIKTIKFITELSNLKIINVY